MEAALILLCAGKGTRMQQGQNKMLLTLAEKPLVIHTIEAWQQFETIHPIILVVAQEDEVHMQALLESYNLTHVIDHIVIGGHERQESVYQGISYLRSLEHRPETVLIHDGARPFIFDLDIAQLIREITTNQSAIFGMPLTDTIKRADSTGRIEETLDRTKLWAIQTPQGFHLEMLVKAHELAKEKQLQVTDDAALMEWFGQTVKVVQGSKYNIKLTTPEDKLLAQYIYRLRED